MEQVIIVNENDEEIGSIPRIKISPKYFYRISSLWITNSKNEILIAKRALTKKSNPGKWGPAVAGTNAVGETYESNIIKEAEEEIGINLNDFNLKKSFKQKRISKQFTNRYFNQWFCVKIDKKINEFKIDKKEVIEIKWIKKEELLNYFNKNPNNFVGSFKDMLTYQTKSNLNI